jgi:aryl-alcohol dehydrogenase-like predicted oxidoreductase
MTEASPNRHPVLQDVELGIGTWAWGDRLYWGYGRGYTDEDLRACFDLSLASGIRFFDSAESYGQGRSETLLGQFAQTTDEPVIIATKFMPYPWRLSKRSLARAIRGSLRRLDRACIDLYQIHWPFPPVKIETWMQGMAEAVQAGLIEAVGGSNYDRNQMQRVQDALTR